MKAISTPLPSTVASTIVSFFPVSSEVAVISTSLGCNCPLPDLMLRRATFDPSRAKISACLQALSSEAVDASVREVYLRGMIC